MQRRWIPIVALNIVCNVPLGFFYVALIQGMATQSRTMWWLLPPAIAIGGSLLLLLMFTVWQVARHGEPRLNVSPAPLMLGDDLKCMLRFEPDNEFKRPIAVWLEVPEELAAAGIDAEVINLRTIRPLDIETVLTSIQKTNRCVTAEEGWAFSGIGSEIAAIIMEQGFDYLDAPVLRVAGKDVPMPYAANLEAMALPQAADIVEAAKAVCYR